MVVLAATELPLHAIRLQIASAIGVFVQVERLPGGARREMNITEQTGMDDDAITTQDIFVFEKQGIDAAGKTYGRFVATGNLSRKLQAFQIAGVPLPDDLFLPRVLLAT